MKGAGREGVRRREQTARTVRSFGIDIVHLGVHTPTYATVIDHRLEREGVTLGVRTLDRSRRLLTTDVSALFAVDLPRRDLRAGREAGKLLCARSKLPDVGHRLIARREVARLRCNL
jgi:hypothetical protein